MAGKPKKERVSPLLANVEPTDPYSGLSEDDMEDEHYKQTWGRIEKDDLNDHDRELQKTFQEICEAEKGRSTYDSRQKLRAALAYVVYASSYKASQASGVPANTIRYWKQEAPWWPVAIKFAIEACRETLDAKLGQVVDEALDQELDRLQKGDPYPYKVRTFHMPTPEEQEAGLTKGYWKDEVKITYVPIKAKDLMVIASIARDKQAILRGEPTSISQKKSDEETIDAIAQKLAKAVEQSTPKSIVGSYDKDGNKVEDDK